MPPRTRKGAQRLSECGPHNAAPGSLHKRAAEPPRAAFRPDAPPSGRGAVGRKAKEQPVKSVRRRRQAVSCVAAVFSLLLVTLLVLSLRRAEQATPRCAAASHQLALLLQPTPEWEAWAGALSAELAQPRSAASSVRGSAKADVLLLASHSAAACTTARLDALELGVQAAFPNCSDCTLRLRAGELRSRAALQSALVAHLRRCSSGLVLFSDVGALDSALVPALLPLLSEGGSYVDKGETVPATGAFVVLTGCLPGLPPSWAAQGEEAARRAAKAALVAALGGGEGSNEPRRNAALALRRRVDQVAPLRTELEP